MKGSNEEKHGMISLLINVEGDGFVELNDKIVIANYELNPLTMVIEPYLHGNKIYSKITDFEKGELFSPYKPTGLVKKGCEDNFTDFNTCKKIALKYTKTAHKAPIATDPVNEVYMVPTISPSRPDCIWIAFGHIQDYNRNDASTTIIQLSNNHSIVLPISYRSFYTQYYKTIELKNKITEKLRENERLAHFLRRKRYFDDGLAGFVSEPYR